MKWHKRTLCASEVVSREVTAPSITVVDVLIKTLHVSTQTTVKRDKRQPCAINY